MGETIWHPLEGLTIGALAMLAGLCGTVAGALLFRAEPAARRLRTAVSPQGLITLSSALTADEGRRVIGGWSPQARESARQQLLFDYWFTLCYAVGLAALSLIAAMWFAEKQSLGLSQLAVVMAWAALLLGSFDFVINSAMLRMLQVYPHIPPALTQWVGGLSRFKVLVVLSMIMSALFAVVVSL